MPAPGALPDPGDSAEPRAGAGPSAAPGRVLRDMAADELPWMAEREIEIFGAAAWSLALIREDFRYGGKRYRVVDVDGDLVAYAIYGYDGDAFHLMNIAVVPLARGAGHGRALMEDFLGEARGERAREAWLEVAVTNTPALALYRDYGFGDVRLRPRYYQPEDVDALLMRAPVPSSPPHPGAVLPTPVPYTPPRSGP